MSDGWGGGRAAGMDREGFRGSRSWGSCVGVARGRAEDTHAALPTKVCALGEACDQKNKNALLSAVLYNF